MLSAVRGATVGTIVAAAATVAVARYDKVAEASVRFNTPSAYQAWSVGSHAVDDNNRMFARMWVT
jgi:hypothetical protein